ncbi:cadmium resistance transporter [Staphylococcus aureus]
MIQTVVTAAILYIATAFDLLVILLIFFARAKTKKEYRDIYIGQYLGSIILILVSLFFSFCIKLCFREVDIRFIGFNTNLSWN